MAIVPGPIGPDEELDVPGIVPGPIGTDEELDINDPPVDPEEESPPSDSDFQPATVAEDLYNRLGPWRRADLRNPSRPLLVLCEALMASLQPVEDVIRDTDDGPGWSVVMDPDRAPVAWLPWLSNFAGLAGFDYSGLTEADFRDLIKGGHVRLRGSRAALEAAPKPYLEGTKTVHFIERHGDAYHLTISVLASEVVDFEKVRNAVLRQKPTGIVINVNQITGGDYFTLMSTHASYTTIRNVYGTYADILIDPSKQ
jgi:hypothetical protein